MELPYTQGVPEEDKESPAMQCEYNDPLVDPTIQVTYRDTADASNIHDMHEQHIEDHHLQGAYAETLDDCYIRVASGGQYRVCSYKMCV